jgi:hypothetical protein
MKQPGLDDRHRDKDGEISRKHGNTLVGTLRGLYGQAFAHGFAHTDTLSDVLKKQPGHASLSQLRDDHVAGGLEGKIRQHGH